MAQSDSEEEVENIDDLDFDDKSSDADGVLLGDDAFEAEMDQDQDDGSDGDDDTGSDDDDDDDEEEEEEQMSIPVPIPTPSTNQSQKRPTQPSATPSQKLDIDPSPGPSVPLQSNSPRQHTPTIEQRRERSPSPATIRRFNIIPTIKHPRSYTVEAICAIAHPEPTHALAASRCMSHLLTGSVDGYIRDYDVYAAVNGKTFLTAPQRQHCGVVEGTMKAGQLRFWWENPAAAAYSDLVEDTSRDQVCSLAMQSDALWALAGSEHGHVNLFTVRHDPGSHITTLSGHRGPVSSLSMQHDEKGFFSAGWDGDVYQWDLNTGQHVRKFFSHKAQVAAVAVRPLGPILSPPPIAPIVHAGQDDDDARSDDSFDPLFDADDNDGEADGDNRHGGGGPSTSTSTTTATTSAPMNRAGTGAEAGTHVASTSTGARNSLTALQRGPPVLDSTAYGAFSPDVLMTASVDGSIVLWDTRVNTPGKGVGRLEMSNKTPPWCVSACWSADGGQVYAGRRNGTVDVWDTRQFGRAVNGVPRLLRTLRNPISSGAVSCVAAFPDGRHIAVASSDNIRLWNASEGADSDVTGKTRSGVPFKIIPGHHGGIISQMVIDPAARFMVTASSNRGWSGESTRTVLIHDIKSNSI